MQVFGLVNVGNTLEEARRCRVTASEHGSRLWIRRASLQSPLVLSYMVTTTNLTILTVCHPVSHIIRFLSYHPLVFQVHFFHP